MEVSRTLSLPASAGAQNENALESLNMAVRFSRFMTRLRHRRSLNCEVFITSAERPLQGVVGRISDTMGRKKILSGDPSEKADRDVLEAMIDLNGAIKLPVGMRVTVEFLR
jgi:hypothetical protein